jgi:uncharacterized protein YgbK (DUF1537 family)
MNYLIYKKIREKYPPQKNESLREQIAELLRKHNIRIVVLDDDPTGIQTVHGNYLLTNWEAENLAAALDDSVPFFYVLTNTRALAAGDAERVVSEVVNAVLDANRAFGYKLVFISRGDSTLRGHFPLEPEVMRREIVKRGIPVPLPTVFTPVLFEAGRYTIDGVHVMKDDAGVLLIPVAQTEFARDNVFGYTRSDLVGYIQEKSFGPIDANKILDFGQNDTNDILYFSLDELRKFKTFELEKNIEKSTAKYIVFDALDYGDLQKFGYALLRVVARTEGYAVLRTSSSMPKALSGIADQPTLIGRMLGDRFSVEHRGEPKNGLFVVGSHVKKTTAQLAWLLEAPGVAGVEIDIRRTLDDPAALLEETEQALLDIHRRGETPVVYTSRQELRLDDAAERQRVGQRISDFLVAVVRNLRFQPDWLVAKGGITSHDILTRGLGIERARVLGRVMPGVPTLVMGPENRFPKMPYIIFPGNVGGADALKDLFFKLVR